MTEDITFDWKIKADTYHSNAYSMGWHTAKWKKIVTAGVHALLAIDLRLKIIADAEQQRNAMLERDMLERAYNRATGSTEQVQQGESE